MNPPQFIHSLSTPRPKVRMPNPAIPDSGAFPRTRRTDSVRFGQGAEALHVHKAGEGPDSQVHGLLPGLPCRR